MADLTIITAIFGDYEDLHPALPQYGLDVDFVCVTDRKREPNGWKLHLEAGNVETPIVMSKRPKCLPWFYCGSEASIWVDASFRITSPHAARMLLAHAHPIAQFAHPERDCVYQEADVSAAMHRYEHLPIAQQMWAYEHDGHPKRWGLWAAGVIARRHTQEVKNHGNAWLAACHFWGHQDQLSEAPTLRESGLRPVTIPGSVYTNPWVSFEPSKRHLEERR